jgi:hypothetical protein
MGLASRACGASDIRGLVDLRWFFVDWPCRAPSTQRNRMRNIFSLPVSAGW